jgi:hypothetical protein
LLSLNLLKLVALKNSEGLKNEEKEYRGMPSTKNENMLKNLLRNSERHLEIYKILGGIE